MKEEPIVLVVHCIDTEGPIGGDVRRNPDGSKEFMDNWAEISNSLQKLVNNDFRKKASDSFGNPYIFNWFIMDFTGFKTNPKKRIAQYNDIYDHIKSLETGEDSFYWHYHHPSVNGVGDQWSKEWKSSDEYKNIILHRLVEREDFPEAFRAGGTIEDEACSRWLEDNIMIDYSNRVSDKSHKTNDIFDFNWYGAPDHWGFYHPDRNNLLKVGKMRRYVVRSVDLRSRLHKLRKSEVEDAFLSAKKKKGPTILSYFSHDHRDMNSETKYVIDLIKEVSDETDIPWRNSNALEAIQICEDIDPILLSVKVNLQDNRLVFSFSGDIFQKSPYVGVEKEDGSVSLLSTTKIPGKKNTFKAIIPDHSLKIVIAGTSMSGNKIIKVANI